MNRKQKYHADTLKEYKFFLRQLLTEERAQIRLRKLYAVCHKEKKAIRDSLKKKIVPRKRGRQRYCFEYDVAKEIVRAEGITSKTQYDHWYHLNNPVRMPKNPHRAYKSVWIGWGDFLGYVNPWGNVPGGKNNGRGRFRSFVDARVFARSLNFKSLDDWRAYVKAGKCPKDIPHRPDVVYASRKHTKTPKECWLTWRDFLGYEILSTEEKIEQTLPVLYLARSAYRSLNNVYIINVIPGGKAALLDHISNLGAKLVCGYYVNIHFDYRAFISRLSPYAYGAGDEFVVDNVFEVMETLSNSLDRVTM